MSTLAIVILVILVLIVFGTFPAWNHSRDWGYGPSGLVGVLLIVLLVLLLMGKINI